MILISKVEKLFPEILQNQKLILFSANKVKLQVVIKKNPDV